MQQNLSNLLKELLKQKFQQKQKIGNSYENVVLITKIKVHLPDEKFRIEKVLR